MADLPERLREAADAHRPDRDRILARVEQARASQEAGSSGPGRERPPAPWMRVAAVTAAVAAAVGLGGLAVGAVTGDASPAPTTAAPGGVSPSAPPPTSDSPRGSTRSGSGASRPATPPAGHTGAHTHRATPTGHPPNPSKAGGSGPSSTSTSTGRGRDAGQGAPPPGSTAGSNGLSAAATVDGSSNDYWTQSDVTLTSARPLTSLAIELRVARTPGVATTGSYDSVSGQTHVSITVVGDVLVYRWELNAGQTLAPGTYTFAAQFQHDGGGRDTSGDTYAVTADGPDGGSSLSGHY